jgi:hypothetical protein
LRCSNYEDLQSDPLSYVVNVLVAGYAQPLPLSFGRWFAPYMFFELQVQNSSCFVFCFCLPHFFCQAWSAPYLVQVSVVDATDHGRLLEQPLPVRVSLSSPLPLCPEPAAFALASSAQAQLEALDSSTVVQRLVGVCMLLRSAPPCDATVSSATVSLVLSLLRCAIRSEPSRQRSMLAANLLSFCFVNQQLTANQFEQEMLLLRRLAETMSTLFQQEGLRVQPVVQVCLVLSFDDLV